MTTKEHKELGKDKDGDDLFAQINWTIHDVKQIAEGNGVSVTDEQALEILEEWEEDLLEKMGEHGWDMLYYGVNWSDYPEIEKEGD